MNTIVKAENLSKCYQIDSRMKSSYATLRETISHGSKNLLKKLCGKMISQKAKGEFWALKGISFEINEGDRIGIIGKNGAGKSTLLKILSRITEPTSGYVRMKGRVSSLLEVGTGFHPELTGRENIFLNGAILGMSGKEIRRKFDEIVAFAEIASFLDIPIKQFSSGMNARLGFAVAAHLDPDLLIVDEVLAVGDAQFQEKCLKKMDEMGSQGRTIIFVSHNVHSILSLCNKGIYLEKGQIKTQGPVEECLNAYMQSSKVLGLEWSGDLGNDIFKLHYAGLRPVENRSFFYRNEKTFLDLKCEIDSPKQNISIGFSVWNRHHQLLAKSKLSDMQEYSHDWLKSGKHFLSFNLDMELFHPGEYFLKIDCHQLNGGAKILQDEVSLKFEVYHPLQNQDLLIEFEKEGISLGNRWLIDSSAS